MEFMDNGGDYFATAMSHLMHLPETIEKMVFDGDDGKRRGKGEQKHQASGAAGERATVATGSYPPVDVLDTPDSYVFYFDVPGLSKSDVQVAVEDETMLMVRGGGGGKRKRDEADGEDGEQQSKYLRLERRHFAAAKFARKFRLPEDADAEAVCAKCEDGVLIVSVGKKQREPEAENKNKTVRIEIS